MSDEKGSAISSKNMGLSPSEVWKNDKVHANGKLIERRDFLEMDLYGCLTVQVRVVIMCL